MCILKLKYHSTKLKLYYFVIEFHLLQFALEDYKYTGLRCLSSDRTGNFRTSAFVEILSSHGSQITANISVRDEPSMILGRGRAKVAKKFLATHVWGKK